MTFHVARAQRTDALADALGEMLAVPLPDPMAQEVVVVPARGVERWLTQRLSHRLGAPGAQSPTAPTRFAPGGVCAGVRFVSPHSLVALLTGRERDDPWDPDRLVWPVLEAIDAGLGEAWAVPLARHLGHAPTMPAAPGEPLAAPREPLAETDEVRAGRRYALARRLAGLFAAYGVQRPTVLSEWRLRRDTDGAGGPLDDDLAWQPELWRRVIERVDAPPPDVRHAETLDRLRAGDDGLDLPGRLSLFGHTRIPRTEIELLGALAQHRDVHLWLPQASEAVWRELEGVCAVGPVRRADDHSGELVAHPLLASLGRDARELQRTLALVDAGVSQDVSEPVDEAPATTLAWLQHDLRAGRPPTPQERAARVPAPGDDSVRIHACHGPARQVEVLREALVGLLADDPTLEPRDIIVMCPDIEAYAPLVQAAFGLGGAEASGRLGRQHPAHRLRVRLADRSLSATNPLAALAADLLDLVGGRMSAPDVLDLAAREPVRRRFGFSDDDLERITLWVEQAAIRWGRDADARAPYGLGKFAENTWRTGLDRLLLGVATAEGADENDADAGGFGGIDDDVNRPEDLLGALPVDDVAGDIDLVGRLAELLDRLGAVVERLEGARTAADWTDALAQGVRDLADVPVTEAWQAAQVDRELAAVAEASSPDTRLRLADVRGLLRQRFAGHPTRANFRTGTLTVATMVPMRSVPHRVVALLGLDDGVFPRHEHLDGDDVLARAPMTGERDGRSEDRQLLLDAIMAATEHLVVTYTGASEHAGSPRPPAVPLGEVIDAVRESVSPEADPVVVRHRLQPFAPENFVAGSLGTPGVFSFDAASLDGARAMAAPRPPRPPLLLDPLPPVEAGDVDLDDLVSFFAHPTRHFLRGRLDVSAPLEGEETLDAMPVDLDSLQKWAVADRLLAQRLAGMPPEVAVRREQLRGMVPPGMLATRLLHDLSDTVGALAHEAQALRHGPAGGVDVDVDLGGRRLSGTVGHVYGTPTQSQGAARHVTVAYSSVSPKRRLEAWLTHLALSAAEPGREFTTHTVGRRGRRVATATSGPLPAERAREILLDLLDVYDRGRREPLPFAPRTSLAWAEGFDRRARGERVEPDHLARAEWVGADRDNAIPGEAADAWHARAYGPAAPLEVLLTDPRDDEGWNTAAHRLGRYALRVWEPLLATQEMR